MRIYLICDKTRDIKINSIFNDISSFELKNFLLVLLLYENNKKNFFFLLPLKC